MMKESNIDVEKAFYRFFFGIVAGFLLGSHVVPTLVSNTLCFPKIAFKSNDDPNLQRITDQPIEASSSGTVYIGMMSMEDKLDSRVEAAINTWMKPQVAGVKIEVFANNNGTKDRERGFRQDFLSNGVRVIQLAGVSDNVYPPQKKSFSMIKFMHDMYIDKYDWFVRLDDDAYVDTEKLLKILSRANASNPIYMGHAGFGKDSDDYIDQDKGENYCMGGTGMIFSKGLLRLLAPKLKYCLGNLLTEHEDIELGRCAQIMAGTRCTMSWDSQKLFFQNFQDGTYAHNIEKPSEKVIDEGVIFHANKLSHHQYNFHVKLLTIKIKKLISRVTTYEQEIRKNFDWKENQYSWAGNVYSHLRWNAIFHINSFKPQEKELKKKLHPTLLNKLLENTSIFVKQLRASAKYKHNKLRAASLESSYHIVNPLLATDIVSQIALTYKDGAKRKTYRYVHQRQYFPNHLQFFREINEIDVEDLQTKLKQNFHQSLIQNDFTSLLSPSDRVPITFVMALSGRPDNFIRFLQNFEDTFLNRKENVNLIITFFPKSSDYDYSQTKSDNELIVKSDTKQQNGEYDGNADQVLQGARDVDFIQENMKALKDRYPTRTLQLVLLEKGTDFSRGVGLQEASKHVNNKDEILFFCDVDLVFTSDILLHIRRNTVQGQRVYYPVFFSQYDPDIVYVEKPRPSTHFSFEELDGFWRYFSYGMFSIFKSDFDRTKGFNTDIEGWGLEDLEMVKAVLDIHLDLVQCPEPAQVHIYHDKFCDPSTTKKQFTDCMNSRATHYGPKTLLYYLYYAEDTNNEFLEKDPHLLN